MAVPFLYGWGLTKSGVPRDAGACTAFQRHRRTAPDAGRDAGAPGAISTMSS